MTHQQRMSRSGSVAMKCAVGESRQRPPLAFVLDEDTLSTRCMRCPVWIHCCKRPNYDFWIFQGSATTVL